MFSKYIRINNFKMQNYHYCDPYLSICNLTTMLSHWRFCFQASKTVYLKETGNKLITCERIEKYIRFEVVSIYKFTNYYYYYSNPINRWRELLLNLFCFDYYTRKGVIHTIGRRNLEYDSWIIHFSHLNSEKARILLNCNELGGRP